MILRRIADAFRCQNCFAVATAQFAKFAIRTEAGGYSTHEGGTP